MDLFKLKRVSDKVYNILSVPTISGSLSIHIKNGKVVVTGKRDVIDFVYQSKTLTDEDRDLIDFIVEEATPGVPM